MSSHDRRFGRDAQHVSRLRTGPAEVIPLHSRGRHFMVLTTQRTGSSWLMDLVNNVPGAEGHMELFYHEPRREPPRAGRNDYPRFVESRNGAASGSRPWATFRYLNRLYARHGAVGFKLMYSQLRQYPEILPWAVARRLALVHLVRDNHLDVILSEELARAVGSSHATVGEQLQRPARIELRIEDLVERIRRLEHKQRVVRALLRTLPNPVHEVRYEALRDGRDAFDRLCAFLELDAQLAPAASRLVKRQEKPHAEAITNYDAVRAVLRRAGLGHLLDSG